MNKNPLKECDDALKTNQGGAVETMWTQFAPILSNVIYPNLSKR